MLVWLKQAQVSVSQRNTQKNDGHDTAGIFESGSD